MKLNLHLTKQLRNFYSLIGIMALLFSNNANAQTVTPYTTTTTWLCPPGVFAVQVECWGAGGGGGGASQASSSGNRSGGGGGAGSYVKKTITVVPGTTYTVTVGAGGAKGGTSGASGYYGFPGGKSEFSGPSITALTASGGTGGTGAGISNLNTNPGGVLGGVYGFTVSGTKTTSYTTSSVVSLTGGSGSGTATAYNVNTGAITYMAATNQGTGYTTAPSVAVSIGAGQTFTALVNPNINSSGAETITLGLSGSASSASAGGAGGASPDGLGGTLAGAAGGTGIVSGTKYEPAQATNAGAGGGGGFSYYAASPAAVSSNGGVGGNGKIVLTYTATIPSISVTPATLSGFSTVPTAPSTAQTFSVSGSLLEADIVITAPTNYEINNPLVDGTYGSTITLTQASGSVAATTINVRLKTGLTGATAYAENISLTTTNGVTQTVACSGGVLAYYYYAGSGSLANVASWSTNANGSGGSTPTNFTTVYQVFVIRNTTAVSTDAAWNVAGTGSVIQVGDPAVPGVALTIASGFDISTTAVLPVVGNGSIDIPAASSGVNSVILQSAVTPPAMGTMDVNSEVHYQATISTATSKTFGKMFIENNSTVIFTGKPIVQTTLDVATGSTLLLGSGTGDYATVNTGATVAIYGSLKSAKAAGAFSYGVTTPGTGFGSIQFKDAVGGLTLGSSSTVEYNRTSSSTAQQISTLPTGVNYNNLTISDSGVANNKLFSGAVTVNNTLTLNQSLSTLTACGNLTLANGATIVRTGGSLDAAPVFGSTVNVSYNGATAITSGVEIPTATSVLNNLTVNNAAGVTLGGNATVNGALTFTAGKITTSTNTLTLGTSATISGAGTGWVIGNLKKLTASGVSPSYTYAIGNATNYMPLALTFSGNTTVAGGLTASTATGDHASIASSGLNPAKSVNRTYTLTNDALAGFGTYDAAFNYASTDNDASATATNYLVRLYDGSSWSTIATSGTPTTTATTATGISSFGGFAIGELGDPPIYTYVGTGDLHNVLSWKDGDNISPSNFTTDSQTFKINTSVTTTAPWTVSGTSSKIVVGDATHTGVSLIIASGSGITATMDVTDGNKVYVQDVVLVAGSTTSYTMNFPTFVTLGDTSEVHYQNSTANNALVKTAFTYGKLYIDGSGTGSVFFSGVTNPTNHIVKTLFEVATGSNAYFSEVSYYYMTMNSGASANIYGTLKSGKVAGFVSSNVGTAASTFGSLQFIGAEALTLGANSTIEFNRASSASTQTVTPRTDYKNLILSGLSNNKSFTGDTTVSGTLTLNITGTSTSTLAANVTVNGALTFTAGKITTAANTLTLGTAGTISGAGTGWVVGNLKKLTASGSSPTYTYAIGDATNYLPLALTFSGTTSAAGGLTASTTSVDHASIAGSGLNSAKSVNRTWTLTNDALAGFGTYDAAFTYATADNDAGTTPANYAVRLYNGSTWAIAATSGTTTDAAASTTGITGFGDFVIGECTPTTTGSVTTSICEGATYVWPANGLSYTTAQSGTTFVSGCNTATLNLTVTPAPASAGTNGSLVICADTSVNESSLFAALGGTPAPGGTWSATTGGAGTYTYTQAATSPCAADNSATVTVTFTNGIAVQPVDTNICTTATTSLASISVVAYGGTPTYTWQYATAAAPSTWVTITATNAGTIYTTYNTATLNIKKATTLLTGTKYRVTLTNGYCGSTVTSNEVTLTVNALATVKAITGAVATCSGDAKTLTLATGSLGTIQWQSSTTSATLGFNPVVGGVINTTSTNLSTYATPALTESIWYRVASTNGACPVVNSAAVALAVTQPAVISAITGGDNTVCCYTAATATAVAVQNSTALSVSTSAGTILWQKSVNYVNTTNAPAVWAAAGSTLSDLTATNLIATTWYRAQITNGACIKYSNVVKITVTPKAVAGTITTNTTSVCLGGDITFTLTGKVGTIQWQSLTSATGTPTNVGTGGTTYTVTNASGTSLFIRAVVSSELCSTATTAVKTIVVNPTSNGGTAKGGGVVCSGSPGALSVAGNVGTIQWQSSSDGITFVNVPVGLTTAGATYASGSATAIAATYLVTNITADTWFRAKIKSGICSEAYSNVVKYTIGTEAVAGTIAASAATICAASGTTLTLSNSIGAITWKKSVNWTAAIPTWTAVASSATTPITNNGTTLVTGNLAATTAYQATVTIGCNTFVLSNIQIVTVNPAAKGGVVAVSTIGTNICSGGSKIMKVTGNVGTIQWQRSTTSATEGFENVAGATTATYEFLNITAPTWFKVVASSGVCTVTNASNAVQITVTTTPAVRGIISGTNSICTANPTSLTLSDYTGTIVWQKATHVNGVTGTFATIVPSASITVTGTNGSVLNTGNLTASTAYRAVVTSGSCVDTTPAYVVTVSLAAKATAITGFNTATTQTCIGTTKTLTLTSGQIGTIEWLSCSTLAGTYNPIANATGTTYVYTPTSTATMYFKVRLTSSPCLLTATSATGVAVFAKQCPTTVANNNPATVSKTIVAPFDVKAYPNPYASAFQLDFTTSSDSQVEIRVYDMIGKLVEARQFNTAEMNNQEVGNNYPSGIYNVIVTQGENMKTLRVIKR